MRNLTVGSPTRLILSFSLPMLLGSLFHQLYAFVDAIVVGRFLGVEALAALGAASGATYFLMGFAGGAGPGITIPVARAAGAGDPAGVRRHIAGGALASLVLATVVSAVGLPLVRPLLTMMGTPEQILDETTTVVTLAFATSVIVVGFGFVVSTIQSLGDSRTPLFAHIGASVLNAVFVLVLVGAAGWGVLGAGAATVFSQACAGVVCVGLLLRRHPELRLRRADWAAGLRLMGEPLRLGLPMGLQTSVIGLGAVVLQAAVNGLGADAVAAFTATQRVGMLAGAPLAALGAAMVTYVAQNRGAGQWQRVRSGVLRGSVLACVLALVLGATLIVATRPIVRLFLGPGQETVVELAQTYFLVVGGLYALLGLLFVVRSAVQGLGLTASPTVSGFGQLVARVGVALVLVPRLGIVGVALAEPAAWIFGLAPVAWTWLRERTRLGTRPSDRIVAAGRAEALSSSASGQPSGEVDDARAACVPSRAPQSSSSLGTPLRTSLGTPLRTSLGTPLRTSLGNSLGTSLRTRWRRRGLLPARRALRAGILRSRPATWHRSHIRPRR